jgi:hypothetical protein
MVVDKNNKLCQEYQGSYVDIDNCTYINKVNNLKEFTYHIKTCTIS